MLSGTKQQLSLLLVAALVGTACPAAAETSAGVGLRFMLPIGPLGIDYAWNLERSGDEVASQVEFMIGHAF